MLEANPDLAVAYGIFSVRQAKAAGHSDAAIRRWIERGRWVRTARGVLEAAGRQPLDGDDLVRRRLVIGERAVVGFAPAARIHGWDLPSLPSVAELIIPGGMRTSALAYRTTLSPEDVVICGVLPITAPVRTAVDLAAVLPIDDGVLVLDSAFRSRQVTVDAVGRALEAPRPGVRRARRALALADPLSGSIPESQARLLFHHANLPTPKSQWPVRVGDRTYRADFAWPEHKLIVEIDGRRWHIGPVAFQTDHTRQNALIRAGWYILRFTVEDVHLRPGEVLAEIRAALAR